MDALAPPPRRQPEVPIWPEPVALFPPSAPPSARPCLLPPPTPDTGLGSPEVTAHPSPGRFPNLTGCQSRVLVCATSTLTSKSESRARSADANGEVRAGYTVPLVCCGARRSSETRAGRASFRLPHLRPSDAVGRAWGRGGWPDSHLCRLGQQRN